MAMVAAACFAQGTSRFVNIENLRYKESDRISDYCRILTRMGASGRDRGFDYRTRHARHLAGGVAIDAHNDHRLLMELPS